MRSRVGRSPRRPIALTVTFFLTVSAEAVISSISRLSQHFMILFNVCGGWELFRRPLTGLYITYFLL